MIIQDTELINVSNPPQILFPGAYRTSLQSVTASMQIEIFASPDQSWDLVSAALNQTNKSFSAYLYQITDDAFCDQVAELWERLGKSEDNFKLLVSRYIYAKPDWLKAQACYLSLHQRGVPVYISAESTSSRRSFEFCHQKFWLVDGEVWLSSGNWGPSDFPFPQKFPPYGKALWMSANRDHNIHVVSTDVANIFETVLTEDLLRAELWSPEILTKK